MKKQLASFRDFLATGILGPLSPEMKMIDVAKVLGTPDDWNVDDGDDVPLYRSFGKVEISFDIAAPYRMNWFQVECAAQLKGKFERVTERLKLSLDKFNGKTKPSEFLTAGLWDLKRTIVYYAALSDDILLNICAGGIQIHFQVDTSFIDDGDAVRHLEEAKLGQLLRDIDPRTKVDSIYSYPQPATEDVPGVFNWCWLTGHDYLHILG
ncbi:hypothetical protein [Mesorhizobium sp. CA7]|uniref:hypothetical protein n=1 Tax=Mesorhizobium sp. CA7 TaxID=588501 RepID=UPI001CCC7DB3|nr:hypothetical protein [Mesorhizobium sp. CA7]MBZ9816856.1 hypothetical protein [Mesorhizobium sp. CA7]